MKLVLVDPYCLQIVLVWMCRAVVCLCCVDQGFGCISEVLKLGFVKVRSQTHALVLGIQDLYRVKIGSLQSSP